ncbi:helix-turn-helix domain-containing protein [Spirosoma migulaei]
MPTLLSQFVKQSRRKANLTQEDLAYKAGVGLRFIRELEQGKSTLRLDKINQVLQLFNHQVGPVPMQSSTAKETHSDESKSRGLARR